MRRWIIKAGSTDLGGLIADSVPIPEPKAGEVRIRIRAASLNARDQFILTGKYGQTASQDLVPLSDAAGEIDAVGPEVNQWRIGDRVTGLYFGGWTDGVPVPGMGFGLGSNGQPGGMLADYVVLPADRVAPAASSLSYVEASTLPCAALTAWTALNGDRPYKDRVAEGDKVLVLGTGGVSLFALLLARAVGAQIFATTSDDAKVEALKKLGASDVINYKEIENWGEVAFKKTGGFKRVVNAAGGSAIDQSMAAVSYGGEIAFMGLFDQAEKAPQLMNLMQKAATLRGVAVGSAAAYNDLVAAVDAMSIKPPIHRVFGFEEAKEAYKMAAGPGVFGKIVIDFS